LEPLRLCVPPDKESIWKKLSLFFHRKHVMGYALIAPAFSLLGVLVAWPFCMAVYFSVTDSFDDKREMVVWPVYCSKISANVSTKSAR
jgi:ABC-type sugar transport system permease subunit